MPACADGSDDGAAGPRRRPRRRRCRRSRRRRGRPPATSFLIFESMVGPFRGLCGRPSRGGSAHVDHTTPGTSGICQARGSARPRRTKSDAVASAGDEREQAVTVDLADHVATVEIHRPPHNWFDIDVITAARRRRARPRRRARVPRRRAVLRGQELLRRRRPRAAATCSTAPPASTRRRRASSRTASRSSPRCRARRSAAGLGLALVGRLPRRLARDPVQLQLRPARVPPGLRHLGDAARGRRAAARARAHVHRRRRPGRGGAPHRAGRPPGRRRRAARGGARVRGARSRRRRRWRCSRSATRCAAISPRQVQAATARSTASSNGSATPTTSARAWLRWPSVARRTSRADSRCRTARRPASTWTSFARWAADALPEHTPPFSAELIAGGQSNITAHMTDADGREFVLRRPPLHGVLPTAHDMGREHRIIHALGPTPVPVPEALAYCADADVIGAPFYVMSYVERHRAATTSPPSSAELDDRRARTRGDSLVDALVELHAVDVDAVGLGDLARRDELVAPSAEAVARGVRSVEDPRAARGRPRARAARGAHPRADREHRRPRRLPPRQLHRRPAGRDPRGARLGDLHAGRSRVPTSATCWRRGPSPATRCAPTTTTRRWRPASPTRDVLLERYAARSGRDVADIPYFVAFSFWRLACILEGVLARIISGARGDGDVDVDYFRRRVESCALPRGGIRFGSLIGDRRERAVPTKAPAITIAGYSHVAYPVDDLDAAVGFYCDVLGFTVLPRPRLRSPVSRARGSASAPRRCTSAPWRRWAPRTGFPHIALHVPADVWDDTIDELSRRAASTFLLAAERTRGLRQARARRVHPDPGGQLHRAHRRPSHLSRRPVARSAPACRSARSSRSS